MSPFLSTSALSRFNTSDEVEWQNAPPDLCAVASHALRVAGITQGAFDPTIGPIVSQFGFGPIKGENGPYACVEVSPTALRKSQPGLTLDLCGIAKGFALDETASALKAEGVDNALIEIGGEVICIGHHPTGRDWQVAITDPRKDTFEAIALVSPGSLALATSGHASNGLKRPISISHIINPFTGGPVQDTLLSVSTLAATGVEADALATALCAMGAKKGVSFAKTRNISAFFVLAASGEPPVIMTGDFARHVLW